MTTGFMRSVGPVLAGTVLSQVIVLIGTVVMARIYDTASFGVFSAWLGGVLFLGVVLSCRFEASLVVEKDGNARSNAVVIILSTIAGMSLICAVLLGLVALADLEILSFSPAILMLAFVPTAAIVASTQTLQSWAAADGRYWHLAVVRVLQAICIVLIQIGIGLGWARTESLVLGYFLGTSIGLVSCVLLMPVQSIEWGNLKKDMLIYWGRHRRFPVFSLPADSISAASAQLPVLMVAARFGAETAGLLAMAMRMLGAPMSLLAGSVLEVFKRHAGQAYRERGECRLEYVRTLRILLVMAIIAAVAIGLGAEKFFVLLAGEPWLGAGAMALWLLPRFAIGFVASPLSYMAYIAGKQHLDLIWQLALLSMTLATLLLIDSAQWALVLYGLGYGVLYLVYLWMSYRFSLGVAR